MLRILIISASFLIVTITLLMIQPSPRSDRFVDQALADEVTRSESSLLDVSLPKPTLEEVAIVEIPQEVILPTPATAKNTVAVVAAPTPIKGKGGIHIEGLEELLKVALERKMSGEEIDAWLEQAAASGALNIPAYMRRADGTLDTPMILSTLVETPNEMAITPKTGKPYIVKSGDSLASIAFDNYGSTTQVEDIFWANRDRLESPDKISVGQTLYLPAL